jgi:hypothetical protein
VAYERLKPTYIDFSPIKLPLLFSIINGRCGSIITNAGSVFVVVASFRGVDFLV